MRADVESLTLFDQPPPAPAEPAPKPAAPPAATAPSQDTAPLPKPGLALLAVDGNSLAHRAYHGYAKDRRGPLHGFLALLCTLAEDTAPAGVVVGFDGPTARSARRARYPAYKAQRPPAEPGVRQLLKEAAELLDAVGVATVAADCWEADDVLASAARAAEAAGWRCLAASSDRDAYGCVSATTTVIDFRRGVRHTEAITPARLRRKPGVRPGQYVEFAALRGDVADNLPGVPGIGPRRAAALLAEYDTVDEAVADPIGCRSVLGSDLGAALIADLDAGADSVFVRNLELMTLRRGLDVDVDRCRPRQRAEAVAAACEHHGLPALGGRMAVALGAG